MFFIKKLVEFSIFPPGIIILTFLLIAFLGMIKIKPLKPVRYILIISLLSALILYLFSIRPVADMLLKPLEVCYTVPSQSSIVKPDAIVVLGAGAYNKKTLDGDSFNRLFEGLKLYKKYRIPIILSGGHAISTFSVAEIMGSILMEMGVNKQYIIIEDKSDDTYENALFTEEICKRRNFKRIILVTSAYHMKRAMFLFNLIKLKEGFKSEEIIPYPADFITAKHYNIYDYIPQLSSLSVSEKALHEYIGYVYYYIKAKI